MRFLGKIDALTERRKTLHLPTTQTNLEVFWFGLTVVGVPYLELHFHKANRNSNEWHRENPMSARYWAPMLSVVSPTKSMSLIFACGKALVGNFPSTESFCRCPLLVCPESLPNCWAMPPTNSATQAQLPRPPHNEQNSWHKRLQLTY